MVRSISDMPLLLLINVGELILLAICKSCCAISSVKNSCASEYALVTCVRVLKMLVVSSILKSSQLQHSVMY